MKRLWLALALSGLALPMSAVADDGVCTLEEWRQDERTCQNLDAQSDRWKFSLGYLAVGATSLSRPELDAGFRVGEGIRQWRRYYYYEYLLPNMVGATSDTQRRLDFFLESNVRCCTTDTGSFQAMDFRGQRGDVYRLWGERRLDSFELRGGGFAASLEYRVAGPVWGAFSFQLSPQYVTKLTEAEGFVRVRDIDRFYAQERYNFSHPVPYWEVEASRHEVVSEVEHKQRAFQFGLLAKVDVTRSDTHWSVMPQAGMDVLLIRQEEWRVDRYYDWRIFSGEYHPSSWAQKPEEVDSRTVDEKTWHAHVRPVVGLTLELWPGRKWNGVGFVVDARYHFTDLTSVLTYESFPAPYALELEHRPLTLSTNIIFRF